jgi:hypothetical protein
MLLRSSFGNGPSATTSATANRPPGFQDAVGDRRAGYRIVTVSGDEVTNQQIRVAYDIEATCGKNREAGLPQYFPDYLRAGGPPAYWFCAQRGRCTNTCPFRWLRATSYEVVLTDTQLL